MIYIQNASKEDLQKSVVDFFGRVQYLEVLTRSIVVAIHLAVFPGQQGGPL